MADLTFVHGLMGSGKSAHAIDRAYAAFEAALEAGGDVLVYTGLSREPGRIKSRDGRSIIARNLVPGDHLLDLVNHSDNPHTVIVDEAQFLTAVQAETLAILAGVNNVRVECFGLLTDFRRRLFPGSARLVELADHLVALKPVLCSSCRRNPGRVNARVSGDFVITDGPQVQVGDVGDEYAVLCGHCYTKNTAPKETAEVTS